MRKSLRMVLCFPFKIIFLVLFIPVITLGYWLIAVALCIPLYFFRKILHFLAQWQDPDICKIVNSMGHLISRDYKDWYKFPSHTVTVICKMNGSVNLELVRKVFTHRVLHRKDPKDSDKFEYPELQQYITKRLGFLFFKWDRTFDVDNHINLYTHEELLPNAKTDVVDEETLIKIWEAIMIKPYLKKRSPWDLHLIPNLASNSDDPNKKRSALILRVQHGLCDGIAVYKLLLTLTDCGLENLEEEVAPFRKAPPFFDLLMHLKAFFSGPASVAKKALSGLDLYNPLHLPLPKKTGRNHIFQVTFELEKVKNIGRVHGVSIHAVLMASLTGAIRNYLLANGHKIPHAPIRIGLPIPKPGHTYRLRNEYLVALLNLPVRKKTHRERLLGCEKQVKSIGTDSFVPFMLQSWTFLGLFPAHLSRMLTLKSAYTVVYSEIKGPATVLTYTDETGVYHLEDLVFSFGLGPDDLYMGFNSLSYNGKIHIILTIDHGITSNREEAQTLINLIEKELEMFHYGDSTLV